jgi:hypothetical protein
VYVVGVNGSLFVLMDETGCFEFWSLFIGIYVMLVYVVVDGNAHVSSCLGGLSKNIRIYCKEIVVLFAFSVALCVRTYSFWLSMVGSLVAFLFSVLC